MVRIKINLININPCGGTTSFYVPQSSQLHPKLSSSLVFLGNMSISFFGHTPKTYFLNAYGPSYETLGYNILPCGEEFDESKFYPTTKIFSVYPVESEEETKSRYYNYIIQTVMNATEEEEEELIKAVDEIITDNESKKEKSLFGDEFDVNELGELIN